MSNSHAKWVDFLTKYAEEITFEGCIYKLVSPEDADEIAAELAALRADRDSWAEQASDRLKDWDEIRQQCEALRAELESAHAAQRHAEKELSQYMAWYAMAEHQHLHEQRRAERAEAEAAGLRADAERWRAVSAMMTHEHRGDAVGWTLSVLLPGDDPDAAIDATLTQEDHND